LGFHLGPQPHVERVQDLAGTLECDAEIFVSLIARDLRLLHTQPSREAKNIRRDEIGTAWMYRIGVPLPSAAVTELADGTEVRHITMGKGIHFDQIAADWQPNHRVRWLYRFASDSFPAGALHDHVRIGGAYFDVIDTEYELLSVGSGTELRVRMKYRVSTAFNWYTLSRVNQLGRCASNKMAKDHAASGSCR
jgi:hypothetical protein